MIARLHLLCACTLSLLLLGCASGGQPKPEWTAASGTDVATSSTFGWAKEPSDARPQTLFESRVKQALREELVQRGYSETASDPDFVVSYSLVDYQTTKSSNPVSIGIGVGSWGGNVGGSVGTSVGLGGRDQPNLQSRLAISMVDPRRNQEVWIGTTTTLSESPTATAIEEAIAGVMEGFPTKRR